MVRESDKHAGLEVLAGFAFPVLASREVVSRAREIAARTERARTVLGSLLDLEPDLTLLVLAPIDWEGRAAHPVYGMPNYDGEGNLIVAGTSSDFWEGFVGFVAGAQPDALSLLTETYTRDGEIDLSPFFDLLAVHELAHRFHHFGVVRFPRLWLAEFFCNLCLHTYVAETEPELLPVLEAFPAALASVSAEHVLNSDLATFEQVYDRMPPQNYGWYQCRLHVAAKRVYDAAGRDALRRLWDRFRLGEDDLARALREVEPEIARIPINW